MDSVRKINITIDGPSAAGKSTIAKAIAKKLGYVHLDSGSMYRCVGLKASERQVDYSDIDTMNKLLDDTKIELLADGRILMDDIDVSQTIRSNEVSMYASNVSTLQFVREDLVRRQQEMAKAKGFVMDGRDIGTVVLKDAELKIYQTASVEARATRRALENKQKGLECDYDKIEQEIMKRDFQDMNREHSPLCKASDAIEIDTSDMSIDEVVEKVLTYAQNIIESKDDIK